MPWPIDYQGGQDDDQTRAIDVVHIEPSIREGLFLVSSLYGRDASAPIRRYPPVNMTPPYLTGDPQIPSILTCNTGQWDASPAAVFAFQWMANGEDIPGANSQTWLSTEEYDNTVITCEVRAYTYLGEDYELTSNSIAISLIEPEEVHDLDMHAVSGLNLTGKLIERSPRNLVVTGVGALNRTDVVRSVSYFTTGVGALKRDDVNAMYLPAISGLEREGVVQTFRS